MTDRTWFRDIRQQTARHRKEPHLRSYLHTEAFMD
jgi:hypothetical protein